MRRRGPYELPLLAVRGGVCRGCKVDTSLVKVEGGWKCRDCDHLNTGAFPARRKKRRSVPREAIDAYANGQPLEQVAQRFGFSENGIVNAVRRAGLPTRRQNKTNRGGITRTVVPRDLLRLYPTVSVTEIARRAGVHSGTVYRRLREEGIPLTYGANRTPSGPSEVERSWRAYRRAVEAQRLYAAGARQVLVAKRLGYCNDAAVRSALRTLKRGGFLVQRLGLA